MELYREDIAKVVAAKTGDSLTVSRLMLDAVLSAIEDSLVAGDKITLRRFGVFEIRAKKGGLKRNPRNGDKVFVRPSRRPHFRASNRLKKIINKMQE